MYWTGKEALLFHYSGCFRVVKRLFSNIKRLFDAFVFCTFRSPTTYSTVFKPFIPARSKLKNFAPKILLCAQLGVLSVRNANIVSDGMPSELGVLNYSRLSLRF